MLARTNIRQASRRAIPAVRLAKAVIPQASRAENARRKPVRRSVAMSLKDIRLLRIRADALLVLRKRVQAAIRQASHRVPATKNWKPTVIPAARRAASACRKKQHAPNKAIKPLVRKDMRLSTGQRDLTAHATNVYATTVTKRQHPSTATTASRAV